MTAEKDSAARSVKAKIVFGAWLILKPMVRFGDG
jgi:hypothetical protein